MDKLFSRIVAGCPVAVMAQLGLEHTLNEEWVNEVFRENRKAQYKRKLLFSTVVDLMGLVAMGHRPSLNAAAQKYPKLKVSLASLYEKINHTEPAVVQALVRGSSEKLVPVMAKLQPSDSLLPGYQLRILDGNHLPASEKRLKVLRNIRGAALPGHSLVVYEPDKGLVTDLFPCEDAYAHERTLANVLFAQTKINDLLMGDRHFCTRFAMQTIASRNSFFLFREHAITNPTDIGKRRKIGRCETGVIYEQPVEIPLENDKRLRLRRIEIVLDTPTTNGDRTISLLSNLPPLVRAKRIARLYRSRWTIEGMFGKLEAALNSEVSTLGYPRAALLAFGCAVLAYNILALIQAAIASVHDLKSLGIELSAFYIADDIKSDHRGMMIALPEEEWTQLATQDPTKFAKLLRTIAKHVVPRTLRKHPRAPKAKKERTYVSKVNSQKHVSTARMLIDGAVK